MAFKNKNLYFHFLLFSLVIYLSSESELNKLIERRVLASTSTTVSSTSIGNITSVTPIIKKPSSGGLSSGAIVAIVIPCVGALLAAGIVAALCRATQPPIQQGFLTNINLMESSVDKFQTNTEQIIVHQQPVIQPEVVQQPVAVVENPVVAQPVPVVQQPVAVVQEPVAMVQQPVAVVQEPVTMVQQPVAIVQQPVAVVQEHATMVQQPVTMVQQPIAMAQQPVTVVHQTVPVQVNTIPVKPIVP